MNRLLNVLLLFLTVQYPSSGLPHHTSAASSDTKSPSNSGVRVLTAKNFDSSLRDGKVWLVEFYAPWCSHCIRFAPTYELIAQQLHSAQKNSSPNARKVNVAKVDGAAERALSSRFSVKGFPSFYLIDGWTVREYDGSRSQENLVKFALEDYQQTEPVPFLFGPFGPMGQARSLLMRSGTAVVGMYESIIERGTSPLIAMSILCALGMGMGLVMIVVVGLLCMPKPKSD
ncbi:hypothetical protein HJC23_011840 [Cyclotella cryptica]|uniref:Thioredoxin domain-containing protein n=1 Tax=Cyclotella cryptica TaxID=29204 RepID=A0ABD3QFH7_9STRA|eukprot:CCRYP_006127-RA/>CCRYP_006127-RA protein AED:0.31 eAED:0.31 QI:492/1/1/1/1/1/2/241/228